MQIDIYLKSEAVYKGEDHAGYDWPSKHAYVVCVYMSLQVSCSPATMMELLLERVGHPVKLGPACDDLFNCSAYPLPLETTDSISRFASLLLVFTFCRR